MVETINELAQLTNSGFGRFWPRHGLKLLYWFANDCISFEDNNEMLLQCDPADGDYGFHPYENRCEYGAKLLPDVDIPYYVVGNLNSPGADQLPPYVSEDKSDYLDDSNTERIIVSVDDEDWIERVYVTQHIDNSNYNPDATFRITRGLLLIIRRIDLQEFLRKTGYSTQRPVQPVWLMPLDYYRPETTTSNVAVVSPVIPPPTAQISGTTIQIDPVNNISNQKDSENVPKKKGGNTTIQIDPVIYTPKRNNSENVPRKGFWDMCTIL